MIFQKLSYNIQMALDSLLQRPLRSFLTSLGIIFGVGAVIAMMAIGQGAQEQIMEQMKILGANNLIIEPVVEQKEEDVTEESDKTKEKQRYSPGLTLSDAQSIKKVISCVEGVSPEIIMDTWFTRKGKRRSGKVVGVNEEFFKQASFQLHEGRLFSQKQMEIASPVCIIGWGVRVKFFSKDEPIGKTIKVGKNWLRVIGVAEERNYSQASLSDLGIRDYDMDIYTPVNTVLMRYKDRARVTIADIQKASMGMFMFDETEVSGDDGSDNYHQVDRMVVSVKEGEDMFKTADIISRMLERRHNGVVDTQVKIPEELLAQKQKTTTLFNRALFSIAAISLLIGGIGIMNIMLASVMERIKEIGIRLSLGATKKDIMVQFLSESIVLSVSGGIIGILFGVGLSGFIDKFFEVYTVVDGFSIGLSFFVAFIIGVVFGFFPARKAALQDPVISLRHE